MHSFSVVLWLFLLLRGVHAANTTFYNPILPGFHPDPSCIFVPEWNDTFFCASSSFNAFPGLPIHASKDLQNWKLIGMWLGLQRCKSLTVGTRSCLEPERTVASACGNQ
jgi:beta-xylosidase